MTGDPHTSNGSSWEITTLTTTVGAAHARPFAPERRRVTVIAPLDRSIVLASTQSLATLDLAAVAADELAVVRRRSGGGAVLVEPGAMVWIDVEIPRSDPLWVDDVGRSSTWLATRCAAGLHTLGFPDVAIVDSLQSTPWSGLVCFAGLAPGEVTVGGKKVLGLAQRRSRVGARFQISVLVSWRPGPFAALFDLTDDARGELVGELTQRAMGLDTSPAAVTNALVDAITTA